MNGKASTQRNRHGKKQRGTELVDNSWKRARLLARLPSLFYYRPYCAELYTCAHVCLTRGLSPIGQRDSSLVEVANIPRLYADVRNPRTATPQRRLTPLPAYPVLRGPVILYFCKSSRDGLHYSYFCSKDAVSHSLMLSSPFLRLCTCFGAKR